jgi:Ni,Fe-hydrogenase III large subunit
MTPAQKQKAPRKERLSHQWTVIRQRERRARSLRIVHIELDRVRGHLKTLDFGHLQLDEAVDEVVVEHAAALEEDAVLVEVFH